MLTINAMRFHLFWFKNIDLLPVTLLLLTLSLPTVYLFLATCVFNFLFCSFIFSLTHSFIHSIFHILIHSSIYSFIHSISNNYNDMNSEFLNLVFEFCTTSPSLWNLNFKRFCSKEMLCMHRNSIYRPRSYNVANGQSGLLFYCFRKQIYVRKLDNITKNMLSLWTQTKLCSKDFQVFEIWLHSFGGFLTKKLSGIIQTSS